MKKSKYIFLIAIFTVSIMINFTGCDQNSVPDYSGKSMATLESLLSLKRPFLVSEENIEKFIDPEQTVGKQKQMLKEVNWGTEYDGNKKLSLKEAEEDVKDYFRYLKDCYAGYMPHGGDEVLANIILELTAESISLQLKFFS